MEPKAPEKPHQTKKRIKTQERFAKKFPFRFSWPTEPSPESPQTWEVRSKARKEQLPLQKKLVPMRSIPSPGLQALEFTLPSSYCAPFPPHPSWILRELKLLCIRFPKGPRKPPPHSDLANEAQGN